MSNNNSRINNKKAPFLNDNNGLNNLSGALIGIIKNNLDPTRAGRLQVYLPQLGGPDPDNSSGWLTVSYASPFRGQTKRRSGTIGYVDTNTDPTSSINNVDENSFQSYGWWAIPPDLNTQVLCTFVNGDPSQGYWFACLADSFDSHMTPGIGSAPAAVMNQPGSGGYVWDPTTYATHKDLQQYIQLSDPSTGATEIPARLPVAEAVLNAQLNATNVSNIQMVPQVAQTRYLGIQGLAFDQGRGTTTASSTRENPSQVFGISTPGRLSPFSNQTKSQQLLSLMQQYVNDPTNMNSTDLATVESALGNSYRAGGHQIVLDDGTVEGLDQGIRIRSATGNTILLDDTNGQIYIITATGNSWVELSPSGRIDMYAGNDFSVRSAGNLNFHADKDIILNAGGKVQIKSNDNMSLESTSNMSFRSINQTSYTSGTLSLGSGGKLILSSAGDLSLQSNGTLNIYGTTTNINSKPGTIVSDPGPIPVNKLIDVGQQSGSLVWWQTDTINSISTRVPAHEPWPEHEVNSIATFNIALGIATPQKITRSTTTTTGVANSKKGQNINEAAVQKQPIPSSAVCGLSIAQTQALLAQIGQSESGGNYQSVNTLGFSGKYQFGAQALETQGYLKIGSSKTGTNKQVITNSSNWTGLNGCNSQQDWLNNPSVQENAMTTLVLSNCKQLRKNNVLTSSSSPETIGGYLYVAQLGGVGAAIKLWQLNNNQGGSDFTDAFGTSASSRYSLGSSAVQLGTSIQNA